MCPSAGPETAGSRPLDRRAASGVLGFCAFVLSASRPTPEESVDAGGALFLELRYDVLVTLGHRHLALAHHVHHGAGVNALDDNLKMDIRSQLWSQFVVIRPRS